MGARFFSSQRWTALALLVAASLVLPRSSVVHHDHAAGGRFHVHLAPRSGEPDSFPPHEPSRDQAAGEREWLRGLLLLAEEHENGHSHPHEGVDHHHDHGDAPGADAESASHQGDTLRTHSDTAARVPRRHGSRTAEIGESLAGAVPHSHLADAFCRFITPAIAPAALAVPVAGVVPRRPSSRPRLSTLRLRARAPPIPTRS